MSNKPSISVKDLYKKEAAHYDTFGNSSYGWLYIEKPAFDTYLKHIYSPDIKVLEIGSGAGRIIEYLLERGVQSENITGLDVSPEMIQIAKKKIPQVHFVEGNAADISLENATYDLIVSSMVFHHTDDDELKGWIDRSTPWGTVMPHYHRTVSDFIKITRDSGFQIEAVDEPEVIEKSPSRLVVVAKR